ncbi:MAG: hypothetical protein WCR20_23110 [Verrucomicrobiota bacterium]
MKRLGGWWRLWILLGMLWGIAVVAFRVAVWPSHGEQRQLTEVEMKMLSPKTQALLWKPTIIDGPPPPGVKPVYTPPPDSPAPPPGIKPVTPEWRPPESDRIYTDQEIQTLKVTDPAILKKMFDGWSQEKRDHVLASITSYNDRHRPVIALTVPSGGWIDIIPSATTAECDEVKQDYSRVQQSILRKDRFSALATGLMIWLIPSLTILAFGLGFRWVVRGFKNEPA